MPRRHVRAADVEPIERASLDELRNLQLERLESSYIGVSAEVVVCDPRTIERSVGKAKRVIDPRA